LEGSAGQIIGQWLTDRLYWLVTCLVPTLYRTMAKSAAILSTWGCYLHLVAMAGLRCPYLLFYFILMYQPTVHLLAYLLHRTNGNRPSSGPRPTTYAALAACLPQYPGIMAYVGLLTYLLHWCTIPPYHLCRPSVSHYFLCWVVTCIFITTAGLQQQ